MASSRYDSTRRAWQDIWNAADIDVELKAVQSARSMATIQHYLPYLPKSVPILEAGSGLSAVVMTLRQMGYNVTGLDYAVNALQASRAYDPTLTLTGGDIHHLPFAAASFGAYLSFGVLEHFEHGMQPALREAQRVLQPNGALVLTIPYPNVVWQAVQLKRRLSGQSTLTDADFYESTYTERDLIANVQQAGFRVMTVQPTSHAFTLWGIGAAFRAAGYYETSRLAERLGALAAQYAAWPFNFMTLIVARRR